MLFRPWLICTHNVYSKIILKSFNGFSFISFILFILLVIKIFWFMFNHTTFIIFLLFDFRIKNICIVNILLPMIIILVLLFFHLSVSHICYINNNLIIWTTMLNLKSSWEKQIRVLHLCFHFLNNQSSTLFIWSIIYESNPCYFWLYLLNSLVPKS